MSLPQYYRQAEGTLISAIDSVTGNWPKDSTAGTATVGTVQIEGFGSVRLDTTTPGSAVYCKKQVNLDLSDANMISVDVYIHTAQIDSVALKMSTSDPFASPYVSYTFYNPPAGQWIRLNIPKSKFSNTGGMLWETPIRIIRIQMTPKASQTTAASFANLRYGQRHYSPCVLSFDDEYAGIYSIAYPYMAARGIRGTIYVRPDYVGEAGRMTLAQLQELYAAGWSMGSHTWGHHNLTDGYSQAEVEGFIAQGRDYLIANGMPRDANHIAFPGGYTNATVRAACVAQGVLTGRIVSGSHWGMMYPGGDLLTIPGLSTFSRIISLATMSADVEDCIAKEKSMHIYGHDVTETPSIDLEISTANFQAAIDYLASKKLPFKTITEWYEGLTDPRYSIVPVTRPEA